MTGQSNHSAQVDAEAALRAGIADLGQRVTELSMLVIDAYQSACAAIVTQERDVSTAALGAAHMCAQAGQEVHRAAVQVLAAWTPTGAELTQIVDLQRTAAEYERMGSRVGRLAEASLRVPGSMERLLQQVRADAPDLLLLLIRHTYVLLRAALLVTARQDKGIARHILGEYGDVVALHDQLARLVTASQANRPQLATALLPLQSVIAELGQLAGSASTIARSCLHML